MEIEKTMETVKPGSYVKVKNYPPIAWIVLRKSFVTPDKYVCVMVGDDRKFEIDFEDIIIINDDEFCRSCGDLNCNWHKYTDSEEYGEP